MKTISKRILSVFLSAVMVVTMLPTFVFTAFAAGNDSKGLVGSYLSKDVTTGIKTNSNVTWDDKEKAAYFSGNESYLLLEGTPMKNVSAETGFAVSFDVKRADNNGTMARVFDFSNGTSASTFALNSGSTGSWERYITLAKPNGSELRYYANDFANTTYCDPASSSNWLDEEKPNVWYNITVSMSPSGQYSYYIDGELKATFKADYYNTQTNKITPEAIMNAFSGFSSYCIGTSVYQLTGTTDGYFSGYIKNVKLYDHAADATQAFAGDSSSDIATLKAAIAEYESRMDGTVYTNMGNAYNAYVAACKAYDSYYYGGNTSVDVKSAASDLAKAAMKMHAWCPNGLTGIVPTGFTKDSDFTSQYSYTEGLDYNNLLYSPLAEDNSSSKVSKEHANVTVQVLYAPTTVMFYDGNTAKPRMPVIGFAYKNTTKARYLYQLYPVDDSTAIADKTNDTSPPALNANFKLIENWHAHNAEMSQSFLNNWYNTGSSYSTVNGTSQTVDNSTRMGGLPNKKWCGLANVIEYAGTPSNGIEKYSLKWFKNTGNSAGDTSVFNAPMSIYVLNYKGIKDSTNKYSANISSVSDYKEGALSNILSAFDKVTLDYQNLDYSTDLDSKVTSVNEGYSALQSAAEPSADTAANYPALRDAFDTKDATLPKFVESGDNSTFSVKGAYNNGERKGFSADSYAAFKTAYEAAQAVMSPVSADGYVKGAQAATAAKNLLDAFNALEPVSVKAPTLTESCYLGPDDSIIITNNEDGAAVYYTVTYNNGSTTAEKQFNDGDIVKPFDGSTEFNTATVTAHSSLNGDDSKNVSVTYTLLKAPSLSVSDGQIITDKNEVTITSNNSVESTLQYSYDGTTWTDYTAPFAPFTDNKTTSVNVYAREKYQNATSQAVNVTNLIRKATFGIYSSNGNNFFDSNSIFTIVDANSYSEDIMYTLRIDGVADTNVYTYNKDTGIVVADSVALKAANILEITAYAMSQSGMDDQKVTAKFYNNDNYNPLAYQESFDYGSVDGTAFDGKIAGVLANGNTVSFVEGAGYVDSDNKSSDWRNNALKINTNTTAPGNKITLNSNPLSTVTNSAIAKSAGATITFWRYLEDADGNTINISGNENDSVQDWLNCINFVNSSDQTNNFAISANGYTKRAASAGKSAEIMPDNQDKTKHAAGNKRGHWIHVAVSIDPTSGVTVYTNGVPHEATLNINGYTGNNAELAKEILEFITDSNTKYTLCNGISEQGNNHTLFLDDIRMYSTVLSQVDIFDMYTDENVDVKSTVATAHDPTAVTVYTLTNGSQVGIEYIEKHNIPQSEISDIDYYLFGTGMTIFHSEDNVVWKVVGDSKGRCGYQNEDLFGAKYTTALSEPLEYAKTDPRDGAGYLVWAPHVMYNITTNKWCYYGSTSSWGSNTSAIFLCESNNITGPYTYKQIVYRSAGFPNAIDPCVYYDKDYTNLYMSYGSWGWGNGNEPIYVRTLSADGTDLHNGAGTLLCRGVDTALEPDSSDASSGEGSYVVYEKSTGYYYLYVSYGQNTGSYVQRVFRSKSPNSGFVDDTGIAATDNTTKGTHGNQILSAFDFPTYNYTFFSTGHNSVNKVKNKNGEYVSVNFAHARAAANEKHNWTALRDIVLVTRQSDITGNVTLQNMIGYTKYGWPVMFPLQYNGTDTTTGDITAKDIEGVYIGNDMQLNVNYGWAPSFRYTMLATSDTEGITYGVRASGKSFRYDFELTKGSDGTNYITVYDKDKTRVIRQGVVGSQTEWNPVERQPKTIYQIAMINKQTSEHTWAYRCGEIPSVDQESAGSEVQSSGVVYTHLANDSYTKYGQEISDDYLYGTNLHQGERCTKISTKYPYYIDTSNDAALYCLTEEKRVQEGDYTGGDYRVTELNDGKWVDSTTGMTYTDEEASMMSADEQSKLKMVYGLKGTVSNYFKYNQDTGKYTESGIYLIVTYTDGFKSYGEYLFLYVMPNPAIAHTLVGMRNTNDGGVGTDARASALIYSRFNGSDGLATDVRSELTHSANTNRDENAYTEPNTNAPVYGTGSYKHLGGFGNAESLAYSYTSPDLIAQSFDFYDETVGVNSGSYASAEHSNHDSYAYTMTSNVVDANYYIDYSNDSDHLITYDSNGVPTGYSFDFVASNLNWNPKQDRGNGRFATSYYRNSTGLNVKTSLLSYDPNNSVTLDKGLNGYSNEETLGYGDPSFGRKVLSGYYDNESGYNDNTYVTGLTKAFDYVDTGWSENNKWQGKITFTGKNSVAKRTDTSSAEKYANFIFEKGSYNGNGNAIWTPRYYGGEEVYSYYNIGVNTCNKGAVREFVRTFANKQMTVSYDSDGNISGIDFVTDTNGKPLDIKSGEYSKASYKEYINKIAQAYWFCENPYNTTYIDDATGETKEYTTAYDVKQGETHALVNAYETGSDIFQTGTTFTDPVQAKLIEDIIDAYNELFTKDDYEASKALFEEVKSKIETVTGDYTSESVNRYNQLVDEFKSNYNYYLDKDFPEEGKEYWRDSYLTGTEYDILNEVLATIENSLMPVVDTSLLDTQIADKSSLAAQGIYDESGNQNISFNSWQDLYDEVAKSNDLVKQSSDADKLVSTETKTYQLAGKTYEIPIVPEDTEANYSQLQKDVNTESVTLAAKELVPVDIADAYESFDHVVAMVKELNRNKYTDEAVAEIDALVKKLSEQDVYYKADAQTAEAYNKNVGSTHKYINVGDNLKATKLNETDTFTASLLTLINTFNDVSVPADDANANKYVKKYKAEFTVQVDGQPVGTSQSSIKYYGDMFNFDAESVLKANGYDPAKYKIVNWSATLFNGTHADELSTENIVGSQKISAYSGMNLERKADTNVTVVATFVKGEVTDENTYRVEIYDVYGKLIDVMYTNSIVKDGQYSELEIGGNKITPKAIPFYSFSTYAVSKPSKDNVITVRPSYSPLDKFTIKAQEGASLSGQAVKLENGGLQAEYDAKITIKNDSIANFYAWAAKIADDKYQVASYSPTYSFFACQNEEYVAITKADDGTYTVDGKNVTASIIENSATENDTGKFTADQFVNQKLNSKAPFTSIQNTVMTSDHYKARVYVRVTEGADHLSGYGIVYKSGNITDPFKIGDTGAYSRAIDNMLSSGQYVVTLNSRAGFSRDVSFRSYINYDFTYTLNGFNPDGSPLTETAKISTIDYSNIAVAKKA